MKKSLALALSFALCCLLVACSSSGSTSPTPEKIVPVTSLPQTSQTPIETHSFDELDGLDVEQSLFSVEFTVPASFFGEGVTQESLEAQVLEDGIKSVTLNEDGSATYVMTKQKHNEMMDELGASIDQSLADMVGSEEYPTYQKVTANADYSEFVVETTLTEIGLGESISVFGFYMYGGLYHAFDGTQVDDITVKFVNVETGYIIEEAHSSDMASNT